jgi:hypothetical protein
MEKFEIIELSHLEMISIEGGKSFCYYLGMIIGAAVGTAVSLVKGLEDGIDGKHE